MKIPAKVARAIDKAAVWLMDQGLAHAPHIEVLPVLRERFGLTTMDALAVVKAARAAGEAAA